MKIEVVSSSLPQVDGADVMFVKGGYDQKYIRGKWNAEVQAFQYVSQGSYDKGKILDVVPAEIVEWFYITEQTPKEILVHKTGDGSVLFTRTEVAQAMSSYANHLKSLKGDYAGVIDPREYLDSLLAS